MTGKPLLKKGDVEEIKRNTVDATQSLALGWVTRFYLNMM